MSTKLKTTLILLLPILTVLILFSTIVYFVVESYSKRDFYNILEDRALTIGKIYEHKKISSNENLEQHFEKLPHEKDYMYSVKRDFTEISQKLKIPPSFFSTLLTTGNAEYANEEKFFKGITYTYKNGEYIIITSAESNFNHQSFYLKNTLFAAVIVTLFISLFISYYFSEYVFLPIKRITERVKEISSENLHLRLTDTHNNDELQELTSTFNNMLDRIETSFETQNNFISNASHELRTPLTAIIGEADVALTKERTAEEYTDTLKIILDEAEKLDKKTQALLFLAQTGFKGKTLKFEIVRIDQLLWDVKETLEKINTKNKIKIDTSLLPENPLMLKVNGNNQLLHLAMANIINNACKYSDYQIVHVHIGASDKKLFIIVKDFGIGIPPEEKDHIFNLYYRASNTKNYEGYGIGLPLVKNILRMHGGEIHFNSKLGKGTTVQIDIPIAEFMPKII